MAAKSIVLHPVTLEGRVVRLAPLSEAHVPELARVGLEPDIWRFTPYGDVRTEADMLGFVQEVLRRQAQGTDLGFAVIYKETGQAIGCTRFMHINTHDRNAEVGGTWYGPAYQRSAVNTECKYLLFRHAFEEWGCLRVQLKTDSINTRSQAAIERLGAVKEGVLRNHMVRPDGTVRDTVMYSLIDSEWPQAKARLETLMQRRSDQSA